MPIPARVSDRAITRGFDQCGTLGSGNHFLEVQVVDRILDPAAAEVMGLHEGQITVLIHSGSRGLGYQVCDDYLGDVQERPETVRLRAARLAACLCAGAQPGGPGLPGRDARGRQLRLVQPPAPDPPGARGLRAGLRQDVGSSSAWSWSTTSPTTSRSSRSTPSAAARRSRSASTARERRAPSRPVIPRFPPVYAAIGQPVIIPGSMGTASWVLVGQAGSMEHSFGTTCHGAGRMMSRTAAVKLAAGRRIDKELDAIGIVARARGHKGLAEEQPAAYKDVDHVVDVVDKVGISKKVARLRPVGVIKG